MCLLNNMYLCTYNERMTRSHLGHLGLFLNKSYRSAPHASMLQIHKTMFKQKAKLPLLQVLAFHAWLPALSEIKPKVAMQHGSNCYTPCFTLSRWRGILSHADLCTGGQKGSEILEY